MNKNRTKCFTSAPACRPISMRMCRQCFNAAQLTARERGRRPQHWGCMAAARCPPPPTPCCGDNTRGGGGGWGGVLHLTSRNPVSFLCPADAGETAACDDTRRSLTEVKWLHTPSEQKSASLFLFGTS